MVSGWNSSRHRVFERLQLYIFRILFRLAITFCSRAQCIKRSHGAFHLLLSLPVIFMNTLRSALLWCLEMFRA